MHRSSSLTPVYKYLFPVVWVAALVLNITFNIDKTSLISSSLIVIWGFTWSVLISLKLRIIIATPDYIEISHNVDTGYEMGVFICLGQEVYSLKSSDALHFAKFKTFDKVQEHFKEHGKVFIFMAKGIHKIKKKAEQMACEEALKLIK